MFTIVCTFLLSIVLQIYCDGDYGSLIFDDYYFAPKIGDCYEVFDQLEKVNPWVCKYPLRKEKLVCLQKLSDENNCGLVIPTNETIRFNCLKEDFLMNSIGNETECFNISKPNQKSVRVCVEVIQGNGIGITTPDNFTILFYTLHCAETLVTAEEMREHEQFLNNFIFDPDRKSCYKIFKSEAIISPYNCFDERAYEFCAYEWEENNNCTVLKTQNDETIVLSCTDNSTNTRSNCFEILTADKQTEIVCLEKLEERCVGITTPSSLRILFECHFCKGKAEKYEYNSIMQKEYRQFIKNYLTNERLGKNFYMKKRVFQISDSKGDKMQEFPYWFNTSCYALTLKSGETILLQCTNEKKSMPGCFKLLDSEWNQEQTVCLVTLEESCVVLVTPRNLTVYFGCYEGDVQIKNRSKLLLEETQKELAKGESMFITRPTKHYELSKYKLTEHESCEKTNKFYTTGWLRGHGNCWGLVTDDLETIVLECPNKKYKDPGCFNIYTPKYGPDKEIVNSSQVMYKACLKILSEKCLGIITPERWKVYLSCYYRPDTLLGGIVNPPTSEPTVKQ